MEHRKICIILFNTILNTNIYLRVTWRTANYNIFFYISNVIFYTYFVNKQLNTYCIY